MPGLQVNAERVDCRGIGMRGIGEVGEAARRRQLAVSAAAAAAAAAAASFFFHRPASADMPAAPIADLNDIGRPGIGRLCSTLFLIQGYLPSLLLIH